MSRTVLEIRTAKDSKETPEATVQLLSSLSGTLSTSFWQRFQNKQPTLSLEIASLNQRVFFIVTCDSQTAPLVKSQIAAQYPTAVITPTQDYLGTWSRYGTQSASQITLSAPYYLPIKIYSKFTDTDPLAALLGVLGKTQPGSAAIIQILLTAAPSNWASTGKSVIQKGVSSDPETFKPHPQQALIEEKLSTKAFHVGIRLLGVSPQHSQAQLLVSQMSSALGTFALSEGNSLVPTKTSSTSNLIASMVARDPRFLPKNQYLNVLELASLYHFPGESLSGLRNIAWGKTIKGEAPDNLPTKDTLDPTILKDTNFFARTEYKNQLADFGIKLRDRRRHFYILGKSGTGKSTLLANMAISDMHNNQGFAVIDPHGDLVEQTLLDYVPEHRLADIAYLDPADAQHPFHLNPLEVKRPEHKELVASGIVSIFQKIFHYSWGPRLEYILRNTLMTLVEIEGSTLLDIPKLLTDKNFRTQLVTQLNPETHQVLIEFWTREFDQYGDKLRNEAIAPILNKVGQFIGSPTIRQILKNPKSSIDLESMMNQGKIVLLNLSQGRLGEDNATLLGAMFITQFQLAAMNRINIPEEQRKDFFLYVDEFQNFATTSFIKILAEARKYRLGLILANQYTAQLPEEIQKAIFGNVGTIATFVMGADDATSISKEFGELYTVDDLVNLGKFQIITKLSIDDRISNPFPAYTLPLPDIKNQNRPRVLEASHSQYSQPVDLTPVSTPSPSLPHPMPQPQTQSNPTSDARPPLDLSQLELGKVYSGIVKNIKDYGAFVEILPGYEGLVHVSNLSKYHIKKPQDLLKTGDQVKVKLYEIDDKNRLNLTMILDQEPSATK